MSKLVITISLDNASFEEFPELEVDNILSKLTRAYLDYSSILGMVRLYDTNGNIVGRAELITDNPAGICATQRNQK